MPTVAGRHRIAAELGGPLRAPAVAIGNFDGVHLGHRALLAEARRLACLSGGQTVALTFDPHPAHFLAPSLAPPMLSTLGRRIELLQEAGAEVVLIEPFSADFAATSAEAFVERVLAKDIGTRHVVVGADFSFGQHRRGNAALLASLAGPLGMGVSIVPPVAASGLLCSSTKIREFVLEGRVEGANLLLGRPFEIDGTVVAGCGRGQTLGVPTANLAPEGEILPKPGVYAGRACRLDGEHSCFAAAISIGTNPTFGQESDRELTVETHLLDFRGELLGCRLRLAFVARLREQRRFAKVEDLVTAIERDIARTREICT
ncbi:MAG: bifunctional riboflavin kinase/FAD synthetase [Deltaproteobacteria bacterium]|nr:bifunctional riboflavin kinase/FAD synthetase [Deltaproteobacteria bacterium]